MKRWLKNEVLPHEPALRAYLRGRFPGLTDVDDVVQESFIRVLRAKEHGTVRSPKSLLFVTARNVATDVFREKSVTPVDGLANPDLLPVIEEGNGSAEGLSHEQELRLLDEAVCSLPEKCRQIIMLKKIHGLSYEEIERKLGVTRNTISRQLTIGVMKCRDFLQSHGVKREKRP